MTRLLLIISTLTTFAFSAAIDTNMVDFPFVKEGPVYLYSLTDGAPDGGKDSLISLEGGSKHTTDSAEYQKLIPLRIEVAATTDSGTSYRISYIGYRENPGFKYMWNSSAFRFARSHQLDYLTSPIPSENVSRYVPMTKTLMVRDSIYGQHFSMDMSFGGNSITRVKWMEIYEGYWRDRMYLGSSILSVAFLNEQGPLRISANGLIFLATSVAYVFQTAPGDYWPLNPGGMFGPLAYPIFILHAAPNAHVVVPIYRDYILFKSGINTDYFPKGGPNKTAFSIDGGISVRLKRVNIFIGALNQIATPTGDARGYRYAISLGIGGFETENRPYFR